MGSACTTESRSPSPVRGRNGVILKRPASVTSYELKMEKMRAEVQQAKVKQQIAENMRKDFEKDRDKLKKEIQLEFEHEKEKREEQAKKQHKELEKNVQLSDDGSRLKTMRVDWSKPESKRIQVCVRSRPLNIREIKEEAKDIVYIDEINHECTLLCPPGKQNGSARKSITFVFDRCYNSVTNTAQVYNEIPYSLVQSFLEGYNATILAYGQTGSGKSFTMQEDPDHIGLIPRAIVHIFEGKEAEEDDDTLFDVRVSYIEIYNEEIRDLLGEDVTQKLEIKQDRVEGLSVHMVNSIAQVAMLLKQGIANRITSATTMNAHSSRSHAIFTVYLQVIYNDPLGHQHIRKAKLNLVDLAGSERHGKTGISTNSGDAFTESKSINLSLSCLGKVIQALSADKPGHVPYRESKLTRLLQDSLGGNARTMMIANISPSDTNFEETLSTLKYAHTTKSVNNKPTMNIENDPKDQLIRELQNEIKNLRHRLDYRALDSA